MSDVHVTVTSSVIHNPAVSPANVNSQPIVATVAAGKTSAVKGSVPGGSVVIANPS